MQPKSSAHYQREYRNRLREQGLVKKEVWILPEHTAQLSLYEKALREPLGLPLSSGSTMNQGASSMTDNTSRWTTNSLYRALSEAELFVSKRAELELLDGAFPVLHIVMYEYGDLPIFLSLAGEQIIVESMLWSLQDVSDTAKFNETVLRTHKFFPLSTISLDSMDGEEFYRMFGALSSGSSLTNVIFEIETLASNVIQATEAYGEFIAESATA